MGCAELARAFFWGLGETNAEIQLDLACSEGGLGNNHFILCLFDYHWCLEGNIGPAKNGAGSIFSISGSRSPFFYVCDQIHYSLSGHCFYPLVMFDYKRSGPDSVGVFQWCCQNK